MMRRSLAAACFWSPVWKAGGVAGNLLEEFLVRRWIEQEQLGIFDGVNEVLRRRSRHQARVVRQPPVLGRELHDVLLTAGVDCIHAHAALSHECSVACGFARPLQEFARSESHRNKGRLNGLKLALRKGSPGFEVHTEPIE